MKRPIFISGWKKTTSPVRLKQKKKTWLQIHRRTYNWEKAGDRWYASRICNNCVTSFLLSFRAWIPTCFAVNYKHPCWSLVRCNLHSPVLIKFGLTRASARDCACYPADLMPAKYTRSRLSSVLVQATSIEFASFEIRFDALRCYTRLQAI